MAIASVGICLKPGQPQSAGAVRGLAKWLAERGVRVLADEDAAEAIGGSGRSRGELAREVDLVLVLGGDGTLLAVARDAGERAVPILGVNLGTLGFMAEIALDEMYAALERVLGGDFRTESRMRLLVRALRADRELGRWLALNDAVISNAAAARMIEVETRVDDMDVTTYHADGLIVSTPTGSTAYSLSAGGPILDARLEAMVLTPISPHTLTHRPVVLPATSKVELRTRGSGEVRLTVDGQTGVALREGDRVAVERSPHPVQLVISPFRHHFAILREKLRWGER